MTELERLVFASVFASELRTPTRAPFPVPEDDHRYEDQERSSVRRAMTVGLRAVLELRTVAREDSSHRILAELARELEKP